MNTLRIYNHRCSVITGFLVLLLVMMSTAVMAAKDVGQYQLENLEFKDADMVDAVRVISELSGANVVTTQQAAVRKVTVFLRQVTVEQAIDTLCKITGLWYRKDPKTAVFRIMETEEYQQDIVVFRNDKTRVFTLRHHNVVSASRAIENLFGDRVELTLDSQNGSSGLGGFSGGSSSGSDVNSGGSSSFTRRSTNSNNRNQFSNDGGSNSTNDSLNLGSLNLSSGQLSVMQQKMGAEGLPSLTTQELMGITRREPPITITINRLHNLLMVRSSDKAAIAEIARLIKKIDLKPPQVLLEMKILELTLGDSYRSVFDIDFTSSKQADGPDSSAPKNPLNPASQIGRAVALGLGNFALEGGSLLFQVMSDNIRFRIQLLEEDNKVNVLATPMLLASNNKSSRLFIGEERVLTTGVKTSTTVGSTGTAVNLISAETEVRDIGNTLVILPQINADGTVTLSIQQDSSSVLVGNATIPVTGANGLVQTFPIDSVNTATLEGTFLARDGLTVAVGGMIRTSSSESMQKIPVLGDIPWLGKLFRREVREQSKTELVLLITPHVFLNEEQGEAVSRMRLDELNRHPNELDIYLDKLEHTRQGSEKGRAISKTIRRELSKAGSDLSGVEQSYDSLIKVAASQLRIPEYERKAENGIRPISLSSMSTVQLFSKDAIGINPVASWTDGFYFVTALKVKNLSREPLMLYEKDIQGSWLATALENTELAPASQDGDYSYLYLISQSRFETAISKDEIYGMR